MFIYFFSYFLCAIPALCVLHESLLHYEILHKSKLTHNIVKRGVDNSIHRYNHIKAVSFRALGKQFKLMLWKKPEIFHHYFKVVKVDKNGDEINVPIDHESFYDGILHGEKNSGVNAHIDNGILTARLQVDGEIFYVEPAWRHLPRDNNVDNSMIVYRESDAVSFNNNGNVYSSERFCASEPMQHEFTYLNEFSNHSSRFKRQTWNHVTFSNFFDTVTRTKCSLMLVADYRFFKEMGDTDAKNSANYIISLIDRVNTIFESTAWHRDTYHDKFFPLNSSSGSNMGFMIKKIVIHTHPTSVRLGNVHYNMEVESPWEIRHLLEVFSRQAENRKYCLAHLFSGHSFNGVLGLAYVASPRLRAAGGVCSEKFYKNGQTLYLNTGLSSSKNINGKRLIAREANLVVAHELAHNWGAEHDPDTSLCSPSSYRGGSYIMYSYAVSGYDSNNQVFSPCSVRFIKQVLQTKSGRCFSIPSDSYCGNLRVEGNEECDAGLPGYQKSNACCDEECNLRSGARCSDVNMPCCKDCNYSPLGHVCRLSSPGSCLDQSYCTGNSDICPPSQTLPDKTPCLERGSCMAGVCLPFCEAMGLHSCMCNSESNACFWCCRDSPTSICVPYLNSSLASPEKLPSGTPCFKGRCNEKGVCEHSVQDVIERFWNFIDEFTFDSGFKFLTDNIVGTVVIISLIVWVPICCLISYFDEKLRQNEDDESESGQNNLPGNFDAFQTNQVQREELPLPTNLSENQPNRTIRSSRSKSKNLNITQN